MTLVLIRLQGHEANAIFVQGRYTKMIEALSKSADFKPEWISPSAFSVVDNFVGVFNSLPVFHVPGEESKALVIDLKDFGAWKSYEVSESNPKLLNISIDPIDQVKAAELIRKGVNKTLRQLLLSVTVLIHERFSYQITHPDAAKILVIK
jgi:hypothetical protein